MQEAFGLMLPRLRTAPRMATTENIRIIALSEKIFDKLPCINFPGMHMRKVRATKKPMV